MEPLRNKICNPILLRWTYLGFTTVVDCFGMMTFCRAGGLGGSVLMRCVSRALLMLLIMVRASLTFFPLATAIVAEAYMGGSEDIMSSRSCM